MNCLRRIFRHPVYRLALPFWLIGLLGVVLESKPMIAFAAPVAVLAFLYSLFSVLR